MTTCSKPYQFLGYWGYNQEPELSSILGHSLTIRGIIKDSQITWGVAYIGSQVSSSDRYSKHEELIIASSSAGGNPDSPDAWVKVQGDSLILGREPFGRVPLYWTVREQAIWFASRLQLLLPIIETPQVSIPGLYGYSCFSYVPTPLTPVADIFAVPAGTQLSFTSPSPLTYTTHRLHEWREAPVLIQDENEARAQLQTLLKDAIHREITHLPSEPVGVFLSGGIDSSTVAALLVQAGVKVRAYALDFSPVLPNNSLSELPLAQQVADFLHIPLVKVEVTPQKIRKAIARAAVALDLPFGDGATLPLFLLGEVASLETSVIFNGENGDQLFAGWTNKPLIAASVYNTENPAGAKDFNQHYLDTFHALYGYEAQSYQPDVYARVQTLNPQDWLQEALDPTFCSDLLARLRRASLMLKGAQNIQPRANNLALSQGLWARSPFCDFNLTEWTFQLPGEFLLQGACEKYILKRAVESWLPPEVVWREKQGMAVPITALCLNSLRSEVRSWLSPSRLRAQGIWQPQLAYRTLSGELGGRTRGGRIGRILWLLMMWQVWQSTILGEVETPGLGRFFYDLFYLPPCHPKR